MRMWRWRRPVDFERHRLARLGQGLALGGHMQDPGLALARIGKGDARPVGAH
jgi:hypothetical protein